MAKYIATIATMVTIGVETEDDVNEWDIQENLEWASKSGYMEFSSKYSESEYLRVEEAMVTVREVE